MNRAERIKRIHELRAEGLSYEAIADIVGLYKSTVRYHLINTSPNRFGSSYPRKIKGKNCLQCGEAAEDTYRRKPICRKCLCGEMPKATLEEQLARPYGLSQLAIAHEQSIPNDIGHSRRSSFSKQLDKSMKKHGIKRVSREDWVVGAE